MSISAHFAWLIHSVFLFLNEAVVLSLFVIGKVSAKGLVGDQLLGRSAMTGVLV